MNDEGVSQSFIGSNVRRYAMMRVLMIFSDFAIIIAIANSSKKQF